MKQTNLKHLSIGIFDSGLGGIGVYNQIKQLWPPSLPLPTFYYISDLAFCPYGEKSVEQIQDRAEKLTETLLQKNVHLIVVACNTATAAAIDHLRHKYGQHVPFVGVEPYLNFVHHHPSKKSAAFKAVVLLTKASAQSQRFARLQERLHLKGKIDVYACEGLAALIENNIHQRESADFKMKLEQLLSPLQGKNYTHAILGCTHYPFISPEIEAYLQLSCVAPEHFVAKRVIDLLQNSSLEMLPTSQDLNPLPLSFQEHRPQLFLSVTQHDPHLREKLHFMLHSH